MVGNDSKGRVDEYSLAVFIEFREGVFVEFGRGVEFVTAGTSPAAFAPSAQDGMVGPDDSPWLLVNCSGGGADVPLREGRHETRNSFTRGDLEFETKGRAVKDMRGDRMITVIRREGDFTVMNHICGEAGGEEELSCSRIGGVCWSCRGETKERQEKQEWRDLPQ